MKSFVYNTRFLAATLFAAFMLSFLTPAQTAREMQIAHSKSAIDNLMTALRSDNIGVKRSAIYFAGKYQVREALPVLCTIARAESDCSIKILAGLSIYSIGSVQGIDELRRCVSVEKNDRVKRMFAEICAQYSNSDFTMNQDNQ